jgi:hypothetical protein
MADNISINNLSKHTHTHTHLSLSLSLSVYTAVFSISVCQQLIYSYFTTMWKVASVINCDYRRKKKVCLLQKILIHLDFQNLSKFLPQSVLLLKTSFLNMHCRNVRHTFLQCFWLLSVGFAHSWAHTRLHARHILHNLSKCSDNFFLANWKRNDKL